MPLVVRREVRDVTEPRPSREELQDAIGDALEALESNDLIGAYRALEPYAADQEEGEEEELEET